MGKATFITTIALFHSIQDRNTHSVRSFQAQFMLSAGNDNVFVVLFMKMSIEWHNIFYM